MIYRMFRIVATGQWIDALLTRDADNFPSKTSIHRASIADALGVNRTSLEVVDAGSDLRTGVLLELPPPSPAGVEIVEQQRQQIIDTDALNLVDEIAKNVPMTDLDKTAMKGMFLILIAHARQ